MMDSGGGWTLVMKINGSSTSSSFYYSSLLWTNTTTLNPTSTDLSATEAKFASYSTVPFTGVLGMMTGTGGTNVLPIPLASNASLENLVATTAANTVFTNLGRAAWDNLASPAAAPQANCNMDGLNVIPFSTPCTGPYLNNTASIRIGILMNQEADCCSPDSYVGFGGSYGYSTCEGNIPAAGALGGLVACYAGGPNIYDMGYLFVR
jgi:hypothetical protein